MTRTHILSGGQTGVDRAALDAALELGLPCGGWCPRGRRAEDGRIADRYPLTETESADCDDRTRRNVRDSDATLILAPPPLTGGTRLTAEVAAELGRPVLVEDPFDPHAPAAVAAWLADPKIAVLNVAGPRESTIPGIGEAAATLLRTVFLTAALPPPRSLPGP